MLFPGKALENQDKEQDRTQHPQSASRRSQDISVPHKGHSRSQESPELMGKEGLRGKKESYIRSYFLSSITAGCSLVLSRFPARDGVFLPIS